MRKVFPPIFLSLMVMPAYADIESIILSKDIDGDGVQDKIIMQYEGDDETRQRLVYRLSTENFKTHSTKPNAFRVFLPQGFELTKRGFKFGNSFEGTNARSYSFLFFVYDNQLKRFRVSGCNVIDREQTSYLNLISGKYSKIDHMNNDKKQEGKITPPSAVYFKESNQNTFDQCLKWLGEIG